MSERPTDSAKGLYALANNIFQMLHAMNGKGEIETRNSFAGLARALSLSTQGNAEMATALRATYPKLNEIDKRLARIEGAGR